MPISKTKLKNAAIAAKSAALPKIAKELLDTHRRLLGERRIAEVGVGPRT